MGTSVKTSWDTALPVTEHAFSGLASFAVGRQALEVPGLSYSDGVSLQPYLCVLWIRTTLLEAAKQREGGREGGRNVRACKASHCRSSSCQEEGMRFRKPKEAGNEGRGTVIESICWKRRMHLVAD